MFGSSALCEAHSIWLIAALPQHRLVLAPQILRVRNGPPTPKWTWLPGGHLCPRGSPLGLGATSRQRRACLRSKIFAPGACHWPLRRSHASGVQCGRNLSEGSLFGLLRLWTIGKTLAAKSDPLPPRWSPARSYGLQVSPRRHWQVPGPNVHPPQKRAPAYVPRPPSASHNQNSSCLGTASHPAHWAFATFNFIGSFK
jgi:hypothetical protein